jgi:hypothetical protein
MPDRMESLGKIEPFPLGKRDVPDRLLTPEKLYGRDSVCNALLAAFDRVITSGIPELVLVSGYSGIGKSSVVNELHKAIVLPRGIWIQPLLEQPSQRHGFSDPDHEALLHPALCTVVLRVDMNPR